MEGAGNCSRIIQFTGMVSQFVNRIDGFSQSQTMATVRCSYGGCICKGITFSHARARSSFSVRILYVLPTPRASLFNVLLTPKHGILTNLPLLINLYNQRWDISQKLAS